MWTYNHRKIVYLCLRLLGWREWNKYLAKEVKEDQEKLSAGQFSCKGHAEDKAMDRNDWQPRIHLPDPT